MSLREDRINLVVTINGDQGRKELGELSQKAFDLRDKMKGLEEDVKKYNKASEKAVELRKQWSDLNNEVIKTRKELAQLTEGTKEYAAKERELKKVETQLNSISKKEVEAANKASELKARNDEYIASSKELKSVGDRMDQIRGKMSVTEMTTKELNAELKKLIAIRQQLAPGTEAFEKNAASIRTVKERLFELNQQIAVGEGFWSRMKRQAMEFGTLAAGYMGFQFLSGQVTNIIRKNADLEDSLANIRKTTGATTEEVKQMNKEFGRLDTRTATADLREIAIIAGQLGIAKEDIVGFVESVDKANVALGDEFKGGASEIAQELGLLRNVFTDIKSDKVDQDLLKIGNALNTLGAQGAATGPVVADFANRIGGVGIGMGLTTGQVLGLSATLQELNVNTERGGTAVTRILLKMTQNTDVFAKVAGMNVKEFSELVNRDLFAAFTKVVEGAKNGGAQATELGKILDELGVDGAGASEVITKLGGNMQLLESRVKLAGDAIKKTDSIQDEFKIKNETLGATLDKLGKKFYAFISSKAITDFLKSAVEGAGNFLEVLGRIPTWLEKNTALVISLAGGTVIYYTRVITTTAATIANTAAKQANNLTYEIGFRILVLKEAATKAYGLAVGVLTGQITLAAAAQRAWNVISALNPFVAIIGGITALAVGIELYVSNTKEAIALEKSKKQLSEDLSKAINDVEFAQRRINDAVENFNQLSPEEQRNLLEQIKLEKQLAVAKLEKLQADQKQLQLDASKPGFWESIGNYFKSIGRPGMFQFEQIETGFKNGLEAAAKYGDQINQLKSEIEELGKTEQKVADVIGAEAKGMSINAQTTAQMEEKLRLLKVALQNSVLGGEDYKRIQREISDVQSKMTVSTAQSAQGIANQGKAAKDATKELEQFLKAAQDLHDDFNKSGLNKDERELQNIRDRYQPLINQAKSNEINLDGSVNTDYFNERVKLEQELHAALEQKRKEFRDRDAQLRMDAEEKINQALRDSNNQELLNEAKKWDDLIALAQKYGLDETALVKAKEAAIAAIEDKHRGDKQKKDDSARQREIGKIRQWTGIISDSYTAMFTLIGASQEEQARYGKQLALFQQAINTGIAVSNAIAAASASGPFPANLLAIGSAIASVLTFMAQAKATMMDAQVPEHSGSMPSMEKGGAIIPDGSRHSEGGLKVIDSKSGKQIAETEAGEMHVFSRKFVERNPELVNAIMDASQNNDGVIRRPYWLDAQPMVINMPRVQMADRYRSFEKGGRILEFMPKSDSSQSNNSPTPSSGNNSELNTQLIERTTAVLERIEKEGLPAFIINSQFDRQRETWEKLKKQSKAG